MKKARPLDLYGPKILCVDADRHTQRWVTNAVKRFHSASNVIPVRTGRQAFTLLAGEQFDLCIVEYALPDMTGVQLCALLRSMGSRVPMIILTAMNRPIDRRRAAECGVDEYLVKPDDLDIFGATIRRLLKRHRPVYADAYPQIAGLSRAA